MSNKQKIIYFLSSIVAIIVAIIVICVSHDNQNYNFLVLLPLTFATITLLYNALKIDLMRSTVYLILYFGYMLRMVITPLAMSLGNFATNLENLAVLSKMPHAILLIFYEFITINIFLIIYYFRFLKKEKKVVSEQKFSDIINSNSQLVKLIILVILIITLAIFYKYPNLKYMFSSLIVKDIDRYSINVALMESTVPTFYRGLAYLLTNFLRLSLPIIIIQKIYNFKNKKISYLLSIIVILLSISFVTLDKAYTLYIAVALLMTLFYMYPEKRKSSIRIIVFSLPIFFLVLMIYSNKVYLNSNLFEKLSYSLQAYSNGPSNVATALSLTSFNMHLIIPDIGSSITFVSYFFQNHINLSYVFNEMFYGYYGRNNHIIPLIGQGYYYFGNILAPILPLLIICIALKLEKYKNKSNTFIKKYIFSLGVIITSVTPILYNLLIFVGIMTKLVLPFLIIIMISIRGRKYE